MYRSSGGTIGGARGAAAPPLTAVCYVWRPCAPSGEYYMNNLQNYANIFAIHF